VKRFDVPADARGNVREKLAGESVFVGVMDPHGLKVDDA
jgi:hypothetical protein